VVALTLDVGQGRDLESVRQQALASGALRAHVLDVRDELVTAHVVPRLHAGVFACDLETAVHTLEAPLLARTLVEIAAIEEIDTIAWAESQRWDAGSMERLVNRLDPRLICREEHRGAQPASTMAACSVHRNVLGTVGGRPAPRGRARPDAPQEEDPFARIDVRFERGTPAAINEVTLSPTELVESLALIAGPRAGQAWPDASPSTDAVPRGVVAAPAAVVLDAAYGALLASRVAPEVLQLRETLAPAYARVLRSGRWFDTVRAALDGFMTPLQTMLTGTVQVTLSRAALDAAVVDDATRARGRSRPEPALVKPL
jgi:argininosuccinate synthase